MRPVYMISGGITKFTKGEPRKSFRKMVKEAFDYALRDCPKLTLDRIDGSVVSYFSDHFTRQLMAGIMAGKADLNPWRSLEWPAIPGYSGKPWFLPMVGLYYKALDRIQ